MNVKQNLFYDTVLWDWNGTLFNDITLCFDIVNTLLSKHGYVPFSDLDTYHKTFCFPIETYYTRAGFDFSRHSFAMLAEEYMEIYTPKSFECTLMPHAREVLENLKSQGVHHAMLSASKTETLTQQVTHYGIAPYFHNLIGIDNNFAKSKLEVGKAWFAGYGRNPETTIMVGDSVHDFEVATALGVQSVLYTGGHQDATTLAATGALLIDDLRELQTIVTARIEK